MQCLHLTPSCRAYSMSPAVTGSMPAATAAGCACRAASQHVLALSFVTLLCMLLLLPVARAQAQQQQQQQILIPAEANSSSTTSGSSTSSSGSSSGDVSKVRSANDAVQPKVVGGAQAPDGRWEPVRCLHEACMRPACSVPLQSPTCPAHHNGWSDGC